MKKKIIFFIVVIILAGGLLAFSYFYDNNHFSVKEEGSFMLGPPLFKIAINEGETISTQLDIKNLGDERNFHFEVRGLEKIVSLNKNNEFIAAGETSHVKIQVSGFDIPPQSYMGHISVSDEISEKKIPFIVSLNTKKQFFAITLSASPENKQRMRGENLDADIKIFSLYNNIQHDITVDYRILDTSGNIVYSADESLSMESRLAFIKKIQINQDIPFGDYAFVIMIKYADTVTSSTYMFSVVDKKTNFSVLGMDFLIIAVSIFVLITFILIVYMLHERNKLFSRLRKQHLSQLEKSSREISIEEKKCLAKTRDRKKRKKISEKFRDARKKIINELKKQQRKHMLELRSLRRSKKEKEEKIKQWDKQSYSQALESAQIDQKLKDKLAVLKKAYSEGIIKRESYSAGVSELESAGKKLKRNIYK